MLALNLTLNCAIVFPLTWAMLTRRPAMDPIYGPDSDARRILACLYGTIGLLSLLYFCLSILPASAPLAEIADEAVYGV